MAINLKNWVDISIKRHLAPFTTSDREVVVVYDTNAQEELYYHIDGTGDGLSLETAKPLSELEGDFARVFESNGGKAIHIVKTTTPISALPRNEIVVTFKTNVNDLPADWDDWNKSDGGIGTYGDAYMKLFIITQTTFNSYSAGCEGVVVKVVPVEAVGAHLSTAAYYSRMKIHAADVVKDYNFTVEQFPETIKNNVSIDDDASVKSVISNHLNCNVYLANAIRNIGGDDTEGNDLTNLYFRIVLTQTLTDRLITLLASKIKYNESGIANVISVISNELGKYITNGLIALNKTWKDESLYIDDELIIAQGSTLTEGFKIHVSDFSTLTDEEIAEHQFPNIYILYADAYNIRKIVIDGEVF